MWSVVPEMGEERELWAQAAPRNADGVLEPVHSPRETQFLSQL